MGNQTNVTTSALAGAIVAFTLLVLGPLIHGYWEGGIPDGLESAATTIVIVILGYFLPAKGSAPKRPPAAGAALLALALGGSLPACATVADHNPVAAAETPEQVAYAVFGTFAATQELALEVVRSEDVPLELRRGVQRAEGLAKPAADALLVGAQAVLRARAAFDSGTGPAEHVGTALAELERLTREAQGPVAQLVAAVQAAMGRKPSAELERRGAWIEVVRMVRRMEVTRGI